MPPNRLSRHRFSPAFKDDEGRLYMSEAVPFPYQDLPDNRQHVVKTGDTLFGLAGFYFQGLPRAAGLWWVIAQFQPSPIIDPTVALVEGTVVVIPSLMTVQQEILNERRKRTASTE